MDKELIFKIYINIASITAILLNFFLLLLAVFKSPSSLKTYSILVINFAITNLTASICQDFTQLRLINVNDSIMHVAYGMCYRIGPKLCYTLYTIMLHSFCHTELCTLLSFIFSYYTLKKGAPEWNRFLKILILFYIPSFVLLVTSLLASQPIGNAYNELITQYPHYSIDAKQITGKIMFSSTLSGFSRIMFTVFPVPILFGVICIKRKIMSFLKSQVHHMSEETKKMHEQFLKALTFNAILPVLFVINGIVFSIIKQVDYTEPLLECSNSFILSLVSIISPLFYLVYIVPYRKALIEYIMMRPMIKSISKQTQESH